MEESKTKICCFDVDDEVIKDLSSTFDVYAGTLGNEVHFPNKGYSQDALPNHRFPNNLHEYDVFIINMRNAQPPASYISSEHTPDVISDNSWGFCVEPPQTLFDPRPYCIYRFKEYLQSCSQ